MWRTFCKSVSILALIGSLPSGAAATRLPPVAAGPALAPAPARADAPATAGLDLELPVPFPLALQGYGTLPGEFAEHARRLSDGRVRFTPVEPGARVKPSEIFAAVAVGTPPVAWSTPGRWSDKNAAFQVFSAAMPFGLTPERFVAWIEGDGGALMAELYGQSGIKALACAIMGPEGGGWYRRPLADASDFRGMTLRWQGLGALVLERLGARTTSLAGADIVAALARDVIDGTEFSVPQIDATMEFWKAAEFYYYPGWHHPATLFDLLVNRATWEAWSPSQRTVIEEACRRTLHGSLSRIEAEQKAGLDALRRKGVEVRALPPALLAQLKAAAEAVLGDQARRSAEFERAYDSYDRHR